MKTILLVDSLCEFTDGVFDDQSEEIKKKHFIFFSYPKSNLQRTFVEKYT
jgi:hypothetical protein